jgi:hypothetical protein
MEYVNSGKFENEKFPFFKTQEEELEYIINRLDTLGVKLDERLKVEDLKETEFWHELELHKKRGLDLAFYIFYLMCYKHEALPLREYFPNSPDLFLFNMRFGSEVRYDEMLLDLIRITKIKFEISNIENRFNFQTKTAGLKFTFNDKIYDFDFKFDDDAIDWSFFNRFKDVFSPYLSRNFYRIDDDHTLVIYTDEDTILKLAGFLNLKWDPVLLF